VISDMVQGQITHLNLHVGDHLCFVSGRCWWCWRIEDRSLPSTPKPIFRCSHAYVQHQPVICNLSACPSSPRGWEAGCSRFQWNVTFDANFLRASNLNMLASLSPLLLLAIGLNSLSLAAAIPPAPSPEQTLAQLSESCAKLPLAPPAYDASLQAAKAPRSYLSVPAYGSAGNIAPSPGLKSKSPLDLFRMI